MFCVPLNYRLISSFGLGPQNTTGEFGSQEFIFEHLEVQRDLFQELRSCSFSPLFPSVSRSSLSVDAQWKPSVVTNFSLLF